jgi:hypothetical protein
MKQYDLAITTAHAYFVISNCLDAFNTLSANILCEDQNLVFDLEAAEITTLCSGKQEFFCRLAEGETRIISHKGPSINKLWLHLPVGRV